MELNRQIFSMRKKADLDWNRTPGLCHQAWVLQQLGRRLNLQKNWATETKPTKINRRTIVRKSAKNQEVVIFNL